MVGVACGALGTVALLPYDNEYAEASAAEMTLDTLGNLTWDEVDGATGYNWSYAVNGGTAVSGGGVATNTANVKTALKAAADEAKTLNTDSDDTNDLTAASVAFSVTPVLASGNGTALEYTHSFTQYIDYGYTTTDIAERDERFKSEVALSSDTSKALSIVNGIYKNELLTLCVNMTDNAVLPALQFSLFGPSEGSTRENHSLSMRWHTSSGRHSMRSGAISNDQNATSASFTGAFQAYLAMGAMDTYDLSGTFLGHTLCMTISQYNSQKGALETLSSVSRLISTSEVENDTDFDSTEDGGRGYTYDLDDQHTFTISTYSNKCVSTTFISTGDLSNALAKIANFGVDTLGNLSWNEIDGATGYQWSYTVGTTTSETFEADRSSVSVRAAIKAAAEAAKAAGNTTANVKFTVTPVLESGATGTQITYDHVFTEYCGFDGDTYDISEYMSVAETSFANAKTKISNPAFYKNSVFTFAVRSDITPLYQFSIGGTGGQGTSSYFMRLYTNGNSSWRMALGDNALVQKHSTRLEPNENHYFSLAVLDTYNVAGETIGETVYLTVSEYDYTTDELAFTDEYVWFYTSEEIATETTEGKYYGWTETELEGGKTVQATSIYFGMHSSSSSPNTYLSSYNAAPALAEKTFTAYVLAGDDILATKDGLKYGKAYDLSDCTAAAAKAGYTFEGWQMEYDGETVALEESGLWWYDLETGAALIEATYSPVEYSVTYDVACDNPTTYTIESDLALTAPTTIPDGKVFVGWYEATDTDFSDSITTLQGKTGDLSLVARFVNGYTITVDGQAYDWKEGDEAFVLTASPVVGKTFSKWQVLSGGEYVDYTGETSFTPSADASFRAVYTANAYTIAYVAEGATHENTAGYTVDAVVSFNRAVKEGYFFLGWYKEATFETLVESTQGYAENLTLYAKFAEDKLPSALTLAANATAQALPVPELPEGAQYSVELYSGAEKLTLTNNAYVFDKEGAYTVKYAITLPTGETVDRDIALTVEQLYTVNVYYGDGDMLTLQVKAGEKLTEADIPETPEGLFFGGLYTDHKFTNAFDLNTAITQDTNIYVKWTDGTETKDGKSNLGWIIGGIVGGVVLIGAGVAVFFVLKKKKNKNIDD